MEEPAHLFDRWKQTRAHSAIVLAMMAFDPASRRSDPRS